MLVTERTTTNEGPFAFSLLLEREWRDVLRLLMLYIPLVDDERLSNFLETQVLFFELWRMGIAHESKLINRVPNQVYCTCIHDAVSWLDKCDECLITITMDFQ